MMVTLMLMVVVSDRCCDAVEEVAEGADEAVDAGGAGEAGEDLEGWLD